MSEKPLLRSVNLKKSFAGETPVELLKDISLELYSGQSVAIMGRSGEGKSTLLHILGTLEQPSSGELFILERKVSERIAPKLRSSYIGFVFQAFHLLEDYTVLQNVLMPAFIRGLPTQKGSRAYDRACELLEQVNLSHRMHFSTRLLSGGEKQRTAIARALLNDPSIIFADEPTGNLDDASATLVRTLLLDCARQRGKGVIIVTHSIELANNCDHRWQLSKGRLQ